jgi:glucose/arabinose dehydrogenase
LLEFSSGGFMKLALCQLLILLTLYACSNDELHIDSVRVPQQQEVGVDILTDRDDVIWGFDFLPDKRIIFSERSGNILLLNTETQEIIEVINEPTVSVGGEGGLLDLKLHPDFENNKFVYFCYTDSGKSTALGRGVLNGNILSNVDELFKTNGTNNSNANFGCRIEFENSTRLFLSIGDQSDPNKAQALSSHFGKILRLNEDGTYPADNPYVTTPGALPEIWSLGHRNPQGLAIQPGTNLLFSSEHGPTGGDELNIIEPAINFGWPLVTLGLPTGELGLRAPGYQDSIASWSPSVAPSGMTFYTANEIPAWKGNLFIATLTGQHIRRIGLTGQTVTSQELILEDQGMRFRNVRQGPDGFLYFSTDDGKIGRILSTL